MTTKELFFTDLRKLMRAHQADVENNFLALDDRVLEQRPNPKEWSILLCFDHLNQTYTYYQAKMQRALTAPVLVDSTPDHYLPSFWGRIYMRGVHRD